MKLTAKKTLLLALALSGSIVGYSQNWKIQNIPIQSRWAKEVTPNNALKEYPRPQLVRGNWENLNGLWEYAIVKDGAVKPAKFDGKILVPYPLESALSGVRKAILPSQNLWYKRKLTVAAKPGEKVLLHFGAVDWQATVYLNGREIAGHKGGYTEFSIDITKYLKSGENELAVKVYDPTDRGTGPHGKQVLNPESIYYTPTSGIWQTVWLEKVPTVYISSLKLAPDIDKGSLNLQVNTNLKLAGYSIEARADGWAINGMPGVAINMPIKHASLWSPEDPYLYHLSVRLMYNGKVVDTVGSYFGMRKISIAKDENGTDRIFLNNKPYFNLGTLDQGFWPDGLYTAPTDEALSFDIKAIKAMGFNTIRKHIKVEPARWYYWADKLGMLVWQDMVNPNQSLREGSKPQFEKESAAIMAQLHNYPSIVTWVLFNEKWGQYDQERLTKWMKLNDPSRLVNGHSGEYLYVNGELRSPSPNAYVAADITDVHAYPNPMISIKQPGKAQVVGEFGGIGVFIPNHQWLTGSAWGYIQEKQGALKAKYGLMLDQLDSLKKLGLSGSIYTQPFDVEGEQNGLMTYDREVIKVPFAELRKLHQVLNPDMGAIPEVSAEDASEISSGKENQVGPKNVFAELAEKDGLIKQQIIDPAIIDDKAPDWSVLNKIIAAKYDQVTADRAIARSQILFYYSRDWPAFVTAIVEFTDKFEDKDNAKVLNTNAHYVLEHSTDKVQLGRALVWSKIATEKDPSNAGYLQTYISLQEKTGK
jgi:hypothetical protein